MTVPCYRCELVSLNRLLDSW